MQLKTVPLQRAFDAMYAAPDYTITSESAPNVVRATVEALARMGVCTFDVTVKTQKCAIQGTPFIQNKVRALWTATLTPSAVWARQLGNLEALERLTSNETTEPPAWVVVDSFGVELVRVRGEDLGEAMAAAAVLIPAGFVQGLRKLTERATIGWLRDFSVDGEVYRLEEASRDRVLVRMVPTREVILIRDTAEEAEAATRRESAELAAALRATSPADASAASAEQEVKVA